MISTELTNKRQQFKTQIRRKHLNELFASERLRLIEQTITAEHEQMMRQLDTPEKRNEWVNSISVQLVEYPRPDWQSIFRTISLGVRAFGENFELWIKTGIIRALVEVLKQEWVSLGLSKLATNILTDIFYQLPSHSSQINDIIEYEFLLNLIELCYSSGDDSTDYYQLMNTMIDDRPTLRDKLIKNGVIQTLCSKLKGYTDHNSDEVFSALGLAFRLVKCYDGPKHNIMYAPSGNVISILIPVFEFYLVHSSRVDSQTIILRALYNVTSLKRQALFKTIMTSTALVDKLMEIMAFSKTPDHRRGAARVINGVLYSENRQYPVELIHRGLFDIILTYSRNEEAGNNRNHRMTHLYLLIISNAVATTLEAVESLLTHAIFGEFVIPCTHEHEENTKDVRQQAFYIIQTITYYNDLKYFTMELLVSKYRILEVLSLGLQTANTAEILLQILDTLYKIIKFYESLFTGSVNKAIDMLERFYNINAMLLKIQTESENPRVQANVSKLFAIINGAE